MSDTLASLRRKIGAAADLESVVRSMKTLAAASIGQYERAVLALTDYYRTVELGLVVCLRTHAWRPGGAPRPALEGDDTPPAERDQAVSAIVFGSDQGLVGQFNEVLADFVARTLRTLPGDKNIWAVGERIHDRLTDAGLPPVGLVAVPSSVSAITPLVGQVLLESEANHGDGELRQLYIFHNMPRPGAAYEPVCQRLLPLAGQAFAPDMPIHQPGKAVLHERLAHLSWPTKNLPEVIGGQEQTLSALVREYLFVSLFKACAESLASENASRLAAMQRAEKNIDDLVAHLDQTFRRLRQTSIDEELFDVLSGYESLARGKIH